MDTDGEAPIDPRDPDADGGLTGIIIGFAIKVSNGLGVGFLEKVYENALVHELMKAGLDVAQLEPLDGIVKGGGTTDGH